MKEPETNTNKQEHETLPARINISFDKGIVVRDLEEVVRLSNVVHHSQLAPKDFDTPQKIAIGLMMNLELGRPLITGLQDLAVINGRCGIYGNTALAMITASGLMDEGYPKEEETGTPYQDDWTFTFTVKRKGRPESIGIFTWADAKRAGLDDPRTRDGKEDKWSPWRKWTRRMMQWKARNFVLRDNFGDVLKGLNIAEDLYDTVSLEPQPDGSFAIEQKTMDKAESLKEKLAAAREKIEEEPEAEIQKIIKLFWNIKSKTFAEKYPEFCELYWTWPEEAQKAFEDKCKNMSSEDIQYLTPPELKKLEEEKTAALEAEKAPPAETTQGEESQTTESESQPDEEISEPQWFRDFLKTTADIYELLVEKYQNEAEEKFNAVLKNHNCETTDDLLQTPGGQQISQTIKVRLRELL